MTLWTDQGAVPAFDAPPPAPEPSHRGRRIARAVASWVLAAASVSALVFVLAPWFETDRQRIADQFAVWTNEPDATSRALADATAMSDEGELIFFASRPTLEATTAFNAQCSIHGDDRLILGCYSSDRIFVFDVVDDRLEGVNEVTAAHEMLHAAYDRLPRGERERIDALVAAFVATLPADSPLLEGIENYESRPGMRADELHSRLGTEAAELTPELEEHFARYFDDRAVVVRLHDGYSDVLDDLESRSTALYAEIEELSDSIDVRSAAYDSARAEHEADVARFNSQVDSGRLTGAPAQAEYERLSSERDALERERIALNDAIDRYNELVAEYESLSAMAEDVFDSLDSKKAPAAAS